MESLFNKYRPRKFDEVVGQVASVKLLREQIKQNKIRNSYIFAGHFGSGKTSMARIFAAAVNCKCRDENGNPCGVCDSCRAIAEGGSPDVIEYAASETPGVEGADKLIEQTKYAPIGNFKVFIIDEVQALSPQAFQRLLKITEEPPKYCVFIFCTTDYDSIPVANRSRIQKYNFTQFTQQEIADRVKYVAEKEGIDIADDVPETIALYAEDSMRNALVILDTAAEKGRKVTGEQIEKEVVGVAKSDVVFDVIQSIADNDIKGYLETVEKLSVGGFGFNNILSVLTRTCDDILSFKVLDSVRGTNVYKSKVQQMDITTEVLLKLSTLLADVKLSKVTDFMYLKTQLLKMFRVKSEVIEEEPVVITEKPVKKEEPKKTETKAEEKAEESKKENPKPEIQTESDDFDDLFGIFDFGEPFGEPESQKDEPKKAEEQKKEEPKKEEPKKEEPKKAAKPKKKAEKAPEPVQAEDDPFGDAVGFGDFMDTPASGKTSEASEETAEETESIRDNWESYIKGSMDASELAQLCSEELEESDLAELARIHKSGIGKNKIVALIKACRMSATAEDFQNGNYVLYLKEDKPAEAPKKAEEVKSAPENEKSDLSEAAEKTMMPDWAQTATEEVSRADSLPEFNPFETEDVFSTKTQPEENPFADEAEEPEALPFEDAAGPDSFSDVKEGRFYSVYNIDSEELDIRDIFYKNNLKRFEAAKEWLVKEVAEVYENEKKKLMDLAGKIIRGEAWDNNAAKLTLQRERCARFEYEKHFDLELASADIDIPKAKILAESFAKTDCGLIEALKGCRMKDGKLYGPNELLAIVKSYIK